MYFAAIWTGRSNLPWYSPRLTNQRPTLLKNTLVARQKLDEQGQVLDDDLAERLQGLLGLLGLLGQEHDLPPG